MHTLRDHIASFRILLCVCACATVAFAVPGVLTSPPAGAAPAIGNDVSWPQCGGAYPTGQDFGIVGVTDGEPDTLNPCLGPTNSYSDSELYWALATSSNAGAQPAVSLYVNSDDPGPTASDWPTSGTNGYGTCAGDDSIACAWQYGAEMGNDAVFEMETAAQALDSLGPPVAASQSPSGYPWWLDVETDNTWGSQANNVAVIQGMVAALDAAGAASVGVYSTSYQWGIITGTPGSGTADISGLPEWIPGAADASSAEAACSDASFTGGPVVLTQFPDTFTNGDEFDGDVACGQTGDPTDPGSPGGTDPSGPTPTRIAGTDAIGTSIAISQEEFAAGSANAVVLARSDFYADALAGGPLAAAVNGPLLITPGASQSTLVDPRVLSEIQRVLPVGRTVYVLGGPLALSPNIDTTLEDLGYQVDRLWGTDEYGTAVAIAEQMGNPSTVFLATGLSFYDALSAVPAAIQQRAAILLTDGNFQAPETEAYLSQHSGDTVYAVGGPEAAWGADTAAIGIYGQDLFGTSAAIAQRFFSDAQVYGIATDGDFADALGGGVFMATHGRAGPLLLVDPNASALAPAVSEYLGTLRSETPGYVFGGPLAVPNADLVAVQQAVG